MVCFRLVFCLIRKGRKRLKGEKNKYHYLAKTIMYAFEFYIKYGKLTFVSVFFIVLWEMSSVKSPSL